MSQGLQVYLHGKSGQFLLSKALRLLPQCRPQLSSPTNQPNWLTLENTECVKFSFKFRVALPIPSQTTRILRRERKKYSDYKDEWMKQNVSGGTHGASKGWQTWPSITGGVCLDTLFHNCHSKQTLENLLSIQGKESRNINRLLNTEKIIYFQHPYHYYQQSVIGSTMKLQWNYKLLELYTVISLFILICVNIWLRSRTGKTRRPAQIWFPFETIYLSMPRAITIVATNSHIRGCHGSSTRSRTLPHWLMSFDDYSSQPSPPPLTPLLVLITKQRKETITKLVVGFISFPTRVSNARRK